MRRARALSLVVLVLVPAAASAQGNPVGPEFRVNTYTPGNQLGSSIAADASGNFVVVWQSASQDGSLTGIFGQRYAAAGTPLGPEFRVNSFTTSNQFGSAVDSDGSGNFMAVWTSQLQDGSAFGIYGQRYASTGVPAGGEFRVNTYTTGSQFVPDVAAGPGGSFVVAWMSPDGSDYGIVAQRYAATGAPLGSEFRVSSYTTAYQASPRIATDSAGNFVVVWASDGQDGSDYGIFGQRYAASGAPFGAEFRVNSYTTSDQVRASVALDASGNFVVAWQSAGQDGSNNGVFGQRYASAGTPLGGEFRVNSYVTGDQSGVAVTADDTGDFVMVWTSAGQDGSNDGVFGQRYSMIVPVELMRFAVE